MLAAMKKTLLLFLLLPALATGESHGKLRALYNSLDQTSISQHLALYRLYPESAEGKRALQHAWQLMGREKGRPLPLRSAAVEGVIALVNKEPNREGVVLDAAAVEAIEEVAAKLPNRRLKGHSARTEEEVLALPPEEVDLARALFLSQADELSREERQSYEAMLDVMALQVLARLPENASANEKIETINHLIFEEMRFRFPPHSIYAKEIDLYTFLPSVLDSRKGVCLGVSILYICLAQRLGLELEMITPPGHIYVRWREGGKVRNIETTARGIHIDSKEYLGVETRKLQARHVKEVVGLAHFNQAAVYWQREEHAKAVAAYEKAEPYLPDDPLLKELKGYNYLFLGKRQEGEALLKSVQDHLPDHAVSKGTIAEDYLRGDVDAEGIRTIFLAVDETREAVEEKRKKLETVLERHPKFRAGHLALATTWLQLHRFKEALAVLERHHSLYSSDPLAEYFLAAIYNERLDINSARSHLEIAQNLVRTRGHSPKALVELKRELDLKSL